MKHVILLSFLCTGCFLQPKEAKKNKSNVYEASICDYGIYIDKTNNVCWLRDGWNSASVGFQIPCEAALKCK